MFVETQRSLAEHSPQSLAAQSVRAALAAAIALLESRAVPSAGLAAELLLMHVLDCDRAWLYAHPEHALTAPQQTRYSGLIARRASGVPTQYLTGRQEFWGLEFEVTPDVLIPRPETEHLIEVALARLGPRRHEGVAPLRLADVGTGSGCLAVALARELPRARVLATDISAAALAVARRNAARHGVAAQIEFVRADILDCCLAAANGSDSRFDLIVSNPPYVALRDAAALPREVREHEPPQALFAGRASAQQASAGDQDDGLAFYPALIAQAAALLAPGGSLVVEIGYGQAAQVAQLLEAPAWRDVAVVPDLAGIDRVVSAQRSA